VPQQQGQPAAAQATGSAARPASQIKRTSFVLLLLGLLGGGLVCLLVVNTTLAANSIEISDLQQANTAGAQRVQQLGQQVAQAQTATVIAQEARKLGLRPESKLTFIDLRSKKILAQPDTSVTELAGRRTPVSTAGKTGHRTGQRHGHHSGYRSGHHRDGRKASLTLAAPGAGR
jgi:hypothetical protein